MQSPIPIIISLLNRLSRAAKQYEMMLDLTFYTDKSLSKRLSHKRPQRWVIMPHQRACRQTAIAKAIVGATIQVPCHFMMTSSNGNIFCVTGHSCGEFTGEFPAQRPVARSFDVYFDLRLNKRLSKQSWCWWFETLPCPLWRHSNVIRVSATHLKLWYPRMKSTAVRSSTGLHCFKDNATG